MGIDLRLTARKSVTHTTGLLCVSKNYVNPKSFLFPPATEIDDIIFVISCNMFHLESVCVKLNNFNFLVFLVFLFKDVCMCVCVCVCVCVHVCVCVWLGGCMQKTRYLHHSNFHNLLDMKFIPVPAFHYPSLY